VGATVRQHVQPRVVRLFFHSELLFGQLRISAHVSKKAQSTQSQTGEIFISELFRFYDYLVSLFILMEATKEAALLRETRVSEALLKVRTFIIKTIVDRQLIIFGSS
jgi:hypothetical protein